MLQLDNDREQCKNIHKIVHVSMSHGLGKRDYDIIAIR